MRRKSRLKKKILIIGLIIIFLVIGIVAYLLLKDVKKDPPKDDSVYVTITFDSDGGSEVPNKKIKEGGTVKLPESEKEGFTLSGWFDGEDEVTEETTFTKSTTLKAKWEEEKKFKVTFDSKGGSKVEAITIVCNKKIELPEEPTKKGYTFVNWTYKKNKDDEEETEVSDGEKLPCEDITLNANWEKEKAETYTVTFDSKGGSKISSITIECEKTLTLPKAPTRDGYTFIAWNDKNGKAILDGAMLSCEDVTLYANWEKDKTTPVPATPTPSPTATPTPTEAPTPSPTEEPVATSTPIPVTPTPEAPPKEPESTTNEGN